MSIFVRRAAIVALLAVAVGGCSVAKEIRKSRSTERSILETGWVKPTTYPAEPLYCYRTLADPLCYDEPKDGEESRIVGYFGPRPY